MLEKYKKDILNNNKRIIELKNIIKQYYNKNVEIFPSDIDGLEDKNELKKILNKQIKDIKILNVMIDIEAQIAEKLRQEKIEKLKKEEKDKVFSRFYRTGIICINGIELSVDRFYIKEIENDERTICNFICTDSRINKKIFGTIEDSNYDLKNIYALKDSKIFYEMYLNKELFVDNRIILNNKEKISIFMEYIAKWTNEEHKKVAERML